MFGWRSARWGRPAGNLILVEAGESLSVIVTGRWTGTGQPPPGAVGDGSTRDFAPLRERARQDGIAIEVDVGGGRNQAGLERSAGAEH